MILSLLQLRRCTMSCKAPFGDSSVHRQNTSVSCCPDSRQDVSHQKCIGNQPSAQETLKLPSHFETYSYSFEPVVIQQAGA